jgi:hypothetical protein
MDKKLLWIRIFLIIYGAVITFASLISTSFLLITMSPIPQHSKVQLLIIFTALLLIIGLAFLVFGILINRIKTKRQLIFILISSISVVWYIAYQICLWANGFGIFPTSDWSNISIIVINIFLYFKVIVPSAIFIIPTLIIWKNLKRIEKQFNIKENIYAK